jgi:hypothetical protein
MSGSEDFLDEGEGDLDWLDPPPVLVGVVLGILSLGKAGQMSLIPYPKPKMVVCAQKGSLALTLVITGDNKFVMSGFLGHKGVLH